MQSPQSLKAPGFQPLNLKCDILKCDITKFAFKFPNLYGYALGARHAVYRSVSNTAVKTWEGARAFAPLEHSYIRYGVASRVEAGENLVLREKNRKLCDKVVGLYKLHAVYP
jgi:hypothetical protein